MTINKDDIKITSADARANQFELLCPYGVFGIYWEAEDIGYGRLELFFDESGRAHIHSEHMDSNNDKRFTKAVLMKVIDDAIVDE